MHSLSDNKPIADYYACLDWQGKPVDCQACAHADLHACGGCSRGEACVQDRYSRRIFSFFERNPELADQYLGHPYFEVRTLASKHVSVFKLHPLLQDSEPEVRVAAAQRLPVQRILALRDDPERKVRAAVAQRLTGADLVPLASDDDYFVRATVARRLPVDILPLMMNDPDADVRRMVARRISEEWLMAMTWDEDAEVRLQVASRLAPSQLVALISDADWRVRHAVASRVPLAHLSDMVADEDEDVRVTVAARLRAEQPDCADWRHQAHPHQPAGTPMGAALPARSTAAAVRGTGRPLMEASVGGYHMQTGGGE